MLSVFVEIVLVDIVSLNVAATVVETETSVELLVGLTEETVGTVVSEVVVSSVVPEASSILLEAIPSSLDVICPQVFNNIPRMITKMIEMNCGIFIKNSCALETPVPE